MPTFIEARFPTDISYGSAGGPAFNTQIVAVKSGAETRNVNWPSPVHKYNVAFGIRKQSDLEAVLKMHHVCQGRAIGFRYKDWLDYKSCDAGAAVTPVDQSIGMGNASATAFQLVKNYTFGGYQVSRKIKKPVSGTVKVALNDIEQLSGWSVSTTTGIVAFTSPPGSGVSIKTGYEFDVPVRFDIDDLSFLLSKPRLGEGNIPLVEDVNENNA
ncbi:MAG: DUF2460 domain-containing protein [Nitrospinae bacterium]|nr:DUF2460 domain-containing protein [Nitrospinota bacterium]